MKSPPGSLKRAGLFPKQRKLFNLAWAFLTITLPGESFFGTALFPRLQIERVALDLFDDIFLLNLALKAPQSAFEGFAILQMDFCQTEFTTFRYRPAVRPNETLLYPAGYFQGIRKMLVSVWK